MPAPRIAPTIAVAVFVWLAYSAIATGIQASAAVPYPEWFATAANAWRVGVASLAVGTALLLLFVWFARWQHLWRDPVRLATTPVMKAAMLLWWTAIAVRIVGIEWARVPADLLLAIVVAGVLVGIAEELLFRGVLLRSLRAGGRHEASAALWTAACFGLFHLPNVFMGMGAIGLVQVVLAALSGIVLYVFRRQWGRLWPAMVAHGTWDISTFLSTGYGAAWSAGASLAMQGVMVLVGIAVAVSVLRHDRATVAIAA